MNSKSEMKRLGTLDPAKVTDAYFKLKAERDRLAKENEELRKKLDELKKGN